MPEFIPVLVAAILVFLALIITFGGMILGSDQPSGGGYYDEPVEISVTLGENFEVSGASGESKVTTINGTVSRGIISGIDKSVSFEIPNYAVVSSGKIELNIINTNLYGPLLIDMNGENIYADTPRIGSHVIAFEKGDVSQYTDIDIEAGSSSWRIWAPTIYKFSADVYIDYYGKVTETFNFDIEEFGDDTYADMTIDVGSVEGDGRMLIKVNNFEVWRNSKDDKIELSNEVLKEGRNTVEVSSESGTRYIVDSLSLNIFN